MKIGENCEVYTSAFGNEPYLIEIGDNVRIGVGTRFSNHDGGVCIFRDEHPNLMVFGKIKIGSNTFIGVNCNILYNTTIGDNCIVAAGSVVKGTFPENSVIMGNPAKVVMKTSIFKTMSLSNKGRVDITNWNETEKDKVVKKHFGVF
jgi:acetyltransferase-like isoleucine patch superfamily enzyme